MMKKVIILQNLVPHYRKPIYNQLCSKYDITILHSGKPSITKNDKYKEIIVEYKKIFRFYFQKNVVEILKKNKYDTIIAMFDLAWVSYIIINFIFPNKIIYWGNRYSNNFLANSFRNFMMRRCKANILYSEVEVEQMIASKIEKEKIFIAHNTILVTNQEDCSNDLKNCFIFVGRSQKRKKVEMLILAFSNVLKKIPPNVILYIIGEGEDNIRLKKMATDLGVNDKVIFTGAIYDQNKLKKYFRKSYAYISPGPVGLGVLHSFSYGVPVVTLDYGKHGPEYQNIIHNQNGILFNNIDQLENIIIKLIEDKIYTRRLGSNAFEQYNKNRNINVMVKGLIEAIDYD